MYCKSKHQKDLYMDKGNLIGRSLDILKWWEWTTDHWGLHIHLLFSPVWLTINIYIYTHTHPEKIFQRLMYPYNFMKCHQIFSLLSSFWNQFCTQPQAALNCFLPWCSAWIRVSIFQITCAGRELHTYCSPSNSGVFHLANKSEIKTRPKTVL